MEQIKLGSTCPLHMPGCNRVQLKCTRLSGSVHGRHSISVKWFLYLWCLQAARWEAWGQAAPLHWPAVLWPAIDSDPENLEHLWPNLQKTTIRKPSAMSKSAYITQYGQDFCLLMACFWIKKLISIKLNLLRGQRGCLCFLVLSYGIICCTKQTFQRQLQRMFGKMRFADALCWAFRIVQRTTVKIYSINH